MRLVFPCCRRIYVCVYTDAHSRTLALSPLPPPPILPPSLPPTHTHTHTQEMTPTKGKLTGRRDSEVRVSPPQSTRCGDFLRYKVFSMVTFVW